MFLVLELAGHDLQPVRALVDGHHRCLPRNHAARADDRGPDCQGAFQGGEKTTPVGSATDAEDDTDGDASTTPGLRWEVLRHHDGDHTHPYELEDDGTILGPPPEDQASTDPQGSYLEINLTATDSQGLSRTVVRNLRPETTDVGFQTEPVNLRLRITGEPLSAPTTLRSWDGYPLNVSAPRQRDRTGRIWEFKSWSDSGSKDHVITTPDDNTIYTATFKRVRR